MNALKKLFWNVAPPLFFFVLVCIVWEGAVVGLKVKPLILPKPTAIIEKGIAEWDSVISATGYTALSSIIGLVMSLVVGATLAVLFSQATIIRRCAFPFAIAFQTVPIVSIAPLIIIWIGRGFPAVVFVSFFISIFPILTNTTFGLINVSQGHYDLFRLERASRLQVLWKLQIPNAMPNLIEGMKISAGLSVLGSVVGEYMVGAIDKYRGTGYWIFDSQNVHISRLFVYVFASTTLGVLFFGAVTLIGNRLILRWREPNINQQN